MHLASCAGSLDLWLLDVVVGWVDQWDSEGGAAFCDCG
jgi:hypothetical protein